MGHVLNADGTFSDVGYQDLVWCFSHVLHVSHAMPMQAVGSIIRIDEGEEIPCDALLLGTPHANGEAYMTTANLDGETSLKVHIASLDV